MTLGPSHAQNMLTTIFQLGLPDTSAHLSIPAQTHPFRRGFPDLHLPRLSWVPPPLSTPSGYLLVGVVHLVMCTIMFTPLCPPEDELLKGMNRCSEHLQKGRLQEGREGEKKGEEEGGEVGGREGSPPYSPWFSQLLESWCRVQSRPQCPSCFWTSISSGPFLWGLGPLSHPGAWLPCHNPPFGSPNLCSPPEQATFAIEVPFCLHAQYKSITLQKHWEGLRPLILMFQDR